MLELHFLSFSDTSLTSLGWNTCDHFAVSKTPKADSIGTLRRDIYGRKNKKTDYIRAETASLVTQVKKTRAETSRRSDRAEPSTCLFTPPIAVTLNLHLLFNLTGLIYRSRNWEESKRSGRCCIFNLGHWVVDFFWQQTALTGVLHKERFFYPGAPLSRGRQWSVGPEPVS